MSPTKKAIADVQTGIREKYALAPWPKLTVRTRGNTHAEYYAVELARIALAQNKLSEFGPSSALVIDAALDLVNSLPEDC